MEQVEKIATYCPNDDIDEALSEITRYLCFALHSMIKRRIWEATNFYPKSKNEINSLNQLKKRIPVNENEVIEDERIYFKLYWYIEWLQYSYTHFNWMFNLALTLRKRYEDAYDKKHAEDKRISGLIDNIKKIRTAYMVIRNTDPQSFIFKPEKITLKTKKEINYLFSVLADKKSYKSLWISL